ncbi:MAG: helix-turn-helix transcriptional regulator [Bacilli bacterium]|nr:helix-turn-helix transcriptional regulator [Bacilli bacterium]MBQ3001819.1 helix-turn-helix transcriptional regulator [Bacilli bacterium]
MTIAEKIKQLRKDNSMTQEDLAEKLNVSRQTISKWETSVTIPDADNIVAISKLFNITTDELLDYRVETVQKKKQFIMDMAVLLFGIIGFIVFAILLMTNQIDETSSVITINGYGIAAILFLILIIAFIIVMIKRNAKK